MAELAKFDGRLFQMSGWWHPDCQPLASFFSKRGLPPPEIGLTSTACDRGYRGIWSIQDDPEARYGRALFLLELQTGQDGRPYAEHPFSLADLFGNRSPPILADWFSGTIRLVPSYDAALEEEEEDVPEYFLTLQEGLVVGEERLTRQESFLRRWRQSKAR